ncbi:ABC transporter ATP-binding protein [Candidatus Aerophobetes bacterium]|nr:ABC transporter ATP-binding protein [Candidatus Aerophobetes bacterium]
MTKILNVDALKTNFYTYEGVVKALDEVNFDIEKGDTLGLVGETGCGKSVTSFSVMRLILPPGKIESGRILFNLDKQDEILQPPCIDLLQQTDSFMQKIRGNEISMIFQEPASALNPVYTVGEQIAESFLLHRKAQLYQEALKRINEELKEKKIFFPGKVALIWESKLCSKVLKNPKSFWLKFLSIFPCIRTDKHRIKKIGMEKSANLLRSMSVPDPDRTVQRYPHELSGGMQQRVVIAIAIACNPTLLIADEPTSNLDVTIQAQILELIRALKEKTGTSILFISHDLGVIAKMCRWVAVMYAGTICELTRVKELFEKPLHPYTMALLKSIPTAGVERLESIKGNVPDLINPPSGCRFHPRCPGAREKCTQIKPKIEKVSENHFVACHFYGT